ncbi:hypothetical protein ACIBSS_17620 [Micromonospora aurantiaca]|uniref:hypothetical protein n=1 Tax=Micromonospora aurantiaca (nom. illeg.) TaxID=47850 RepID=UPI003797AD0D
MITLTDEEARIVVCALSDYLEEVVAEADHLAGVDDPAKRARGRDVDARAQQVRALLIKLGAPDEHWRWFPPAPDALPDDLA